jgi:hypothetical protein
MKHKSLLYYIALAFLPVSCADYAEESSGSEDTALPIELTANYPVSSHLTRADIDNGFLANDAVGIFVVDYDAEGNAGVPALKGERAGNIRFVYDGSRWTANYQLYWKNTTTPADFYGYYPYDGQMESVTEYNFIVSSQQNASVTSTAAAGYEQSDLLWAKAEKIMPTAETVCLNYKHLMAGVCIQLDMGTGFTSDEWASLEKAVQVESTVLNGVVDLSTGTVTVGDGHSAAITPLMHNGNYRAVVFPQTVPAGMPLATVDIDGHSYSLTKTAATSYLSGKMHNMTITVNKSSATGDYTLELKADDIVAWIDDPGLHDGLVRQYSVVTLTEAGTLKQEVDKICDDYDMLSSLKVIGPMNSTDRDFIRWHLLNLRDVNFAKVEMEDHRLGGFADHKRLQHFVFPETGVHIIEGQAFFAAPLVGDLVIPEGVERIEGEAFMNCGMKGRLSFPSTLKRVEGGAFSFNSFTGELRLPEGIEYLDPGYYFCFQGSDFEGTLYLPPSLTSLSNMAFPKVTGTLVIPPAVTEIPGNCFQGIGCTQVEFHDGVTVIGGAAFCGSQLSGELVLPPNLKKLGGAAFAGTRITKIVFPDNLRIMENGGYNFEGIFAGCEHLMGTVELPKHVVRIPGGCFRNCTAITGLVIPEGVDIIDQIAFENCYNLNSIVCEDEDPPVVCANAFRGVPKDNFTVEVPKRCVEKYREAEGWKEFKRIAEYSNFVCRPQAACALNTAHTEQLVLNADGAWTVKSQPSWVTLSKTSGTGKTELTLVFQQMAFGSGNRQDTIRFAMTGANYETFCVVRQYDYQYEEDSYLALQTHTKGRGIDIVFMGDGFDGEDISNENYLNLVKEQTEHFFDLEPYKSHRDFFNVYVTFPLSQEKGVNTMNTYVNNHFGTLYGYDGLCCTSNQLITEADEVRDYAAEHTPLTKDDLWRSLIILVPNSDAYEGVTYFEWYGSPISLCPPSSRPYPQDTRGVVQHEAGGHGFGRLGDEGIVYSAWAPSGVKDIVERKHSSGEYANLSTTSGLHSVPWAEFVFDTRYSDYVDVFEGGLSYMRGIFRPEQNSCMNYGIPYYNAPSRLSIMRRIFDYAGEGFSMDYFYAHDSKAWGNTATRAATRGGEGSIGGSSYSGSNLHHIPLTVNGREMGNQVRKIRTQLKNKKR